MKSHPAMAAVQPRTPPPRSRPRLRSHMRAGAIRSLTVVPTARPPLAIATGPPTRATRRATRPTASCRFASRSAIVDVCPVQCIYEYDPEKNILFSEVQAGNGEIENTHTPNPDAIAVFGDSTLYVNLDECTSCTNCYQPDVCPVGAIYSEEHVPNGTPRGAKYNAADENKGHDHTFFIQHSRDVFAD